MGKRFIKAFVILEILLVIAIVGFAAPIYFGVWELPEFLQGREEEPAAAPKALVRVDNIKKATVMPSLTRVGISAEVRYEHGFIYVRQQIALVEPVQNFLGYLYAENFARVTIHSVGAAGGAGIISYSHNDYAVSIEANSPSGGFSIEYSVELGQNGDIMSYNDQMVMLTNFLIIPEITIDGRVVEAYKSGFGDPFVYEIYNYDLSVELPGVYEIYAPGKISENGIEDGYKRVTFSASNMRDFPIVICAEAEVVTEMVNETTIYYINSDKCSPFANYAFNFAEENIGYYPYKELFIVKAPITQNSGMEFSCMIFIADRCFDDLETLKSLTYHEIMHEWFYGIIGINQIDEPFLDEGMVTFLDGHLRNRRGLGLYYHQFMTMGLKDYQSKSQYSAYAYSAASAYIGTLHRDMGDEAFFKMLQAIFNEQGFGILTFDEFKGYIDRFSGEGG